MSQSGLSHGLEDLAVVTADLGLVDEAMLSTVNQVAASAVPLAGHLLEVGGKRLRPTLVLAAARALAGSPATVPADARAIAAAVAVELMHVGSLYHDDVIDEATTRRSVASPNARWGNSRAVLGGDLLLALSAKLAADLGLAESQVLAMTLLALCEGQLHESRDAFDVGRSLASYFAAIDGKTASLFAASCMLGGLQADVSAADVEAVGRFGSQLGRAFQIADDVLDLVGDPVRLGKPVGSDVRQGVYTLPLLLVMTGGGAACRDLTGAVVEGDVDGILAVLASAGAIGRALHVADELAASAARAAATVRDPRPLHAVVELVMEPVSHLARERSLLDEEALHLILVEGEVRDRIRL